jgi:hypothetical protein
MLPLIFRPNGLRNSPAFAPFTDWSVLEDGQEVGHIDIQNAPATPKMGLVLGDYADGAESDRHPDEWTRRDLRGREGAVPRALVELVEAGAGLT